MALVMTDKAAEEVKRVHAEQKLGDEMFLRISVAGGGCSGFSYAMGFDSSYDRAVDAQYEFGGCKVVVDKKSALYLDGATVDWFDTPERRGFAFDNPNAISSCGSCGGH
jgi:iron-sulfur cluster assembly accessory protein